ncbi:MAG: thiamine pyrophosphate-dependent dehydrogenase E1 component subunit alpha [Acidobacteria bacterium]|nr:MAG: thiamine pyrophosphate-dependent dehydrogenase E1 component subunit alpha [Acidobacteriota bacterium]
MLSRYSGEFLADLYRTLYTIRRFETECIRLYRDGFIRGYFHPYLGEEAIAVGACAALRPTDFITSTHRGHGHCIARGAELRPMVAELLGRKTGYCQGLGGSMHIADVAAGNLGANGIVGGGLPIGVGAALASKLRGDERVTVVFLSDGAVNNGVFCESLNLAATWSLPLILLIENNQYAVSTPVEQATREPELYRRGAAFGVSSHQIDGNDVLAVYEKVREACAACRDSAGPVLLEAKTFRHGGHHVNDPGAYMPKERLDYYKSIDPVERGRRNLRDSGVPEEEISVLERRVEEAMQDAIDFAKSSPEMPIEEFLQIVEAY